MSFRRRRSLVPRRRRLQPRIQLFRSGTLQDRLHRTCRIISINPQPQDNPDRRPPGIHVCYATVIFQIFQPQIPEAWKSRRKDPLPPGNCRTSPPSCGNDICFEKRPASWDRSHTICLPSLFGQCNISKGNGKKTSGKAAGSKTLLQIHRQKGQMAFKLQDERKRGLPS